MSQSELPDTPEPHWTFGSLATGADGVVEIKPGPLADQEEVARVQAALDLLQALEPNATIHEYLEAAEQFVDSLAVLASAGAPRPPGLVRRVEAATSAWLSAFTRLRADLESKEKRFGNGEAVRKRYRELHAGDWHFRLVHELRNVSQHEGDAHHYLELGTHLSPGEEQPTQTLEIDVAKLLRRSKVHHLNGLRALLPPVERVDVEQLLRRVDELAADLLMRMLGSNSDALDAAISEVVEAHNRHGEKGKSLHLFRFDRAGGRSEGETSTKFDMRAIDLRQLPSYALSISLARAHCAALAAND